MIEKIQKVQKGLNKKLNDSGWTHIQNFIQTDRFLEILTFIHDETKSKGKTSTPKIKNIFKPFELCKAKDLKVVIIRSAPYSNGEATGLAFETESKQIPKPAQHLLNAVNNVNFNPSSSLKEIDYESWSKQGVLLLNASLTAFQDSTYCEDLWRDFYASLLTYLNIKNSGILYIFVGEGFNTSLKGLIDQEYNTVKVIKSSRDWVEAISFINEKQLALVGENFNW
jgi:uracil-DNA glycosylase